MFYVESSLEENQVGKILNWNIMNTKTFILSICILAMAIVGVTLIQLRNEPVVIKTNLENIPMKIGEYTGTEDSFSEGVYKTLNADKHVYRHYVSKDGSQVDLYIGYYGTAKGGRTSHDPYGCLPGAGWAIVKSEKVRLSEDSFPDGVTINYILSKKGNDYQVVFHWYQSAKTKVLSTGVQQNIQRFVGRIMHNRNDGAFVQITVLSDVKRLEKSRSIGLHFAENIIELLPEYWPVEM